MNSRDLEIKKFEMNAKLTILISLYTRKLKELSSEGNQVCIHFS